MSADTGYLDWLADQAEARAGAAKLAGDHAAATVEQATARELREQATRLRWQLRR